MKSSSEGGGREDWTGMALFVAPGHHILYTRRSEGDGGGAGEELLRLGSHAKTRPLWAWNLGP